MTDKYVCTLACRDITRIFPGALPCVFYSDSKHVDYPKDPSLKVFQCNFGYGAIFAKKVTNDPAPIIDADQDQRDQLTTRLSLRREK